MSMMSTMLSDFARDAAFNAGRELNRWLVRRRQEALGSPSYDTAKQVVTLLGEGDYWSVTSILGALTPAELAEVADKTIALGADPDVLRSLLASLGKAEIIEIVDSAPKVKLPLWVILLTAGGTIGIGWLVFAAVRRR